MALYSLKPSAQRIAGSRGGSTFTKTPAGYIIRRRFKPKTIVNEKTTAVRARFLTAVGVFRTLRPVFKMQWVAEAPNFVRQNSLGESYALTPIQLATSQNVIELQAGQGEMVLPGLKTDVIPPVTAGSGWSLSPPSLVLGIANSLYTAQSELIVSLTPSGDYPILPSYTPDLRRALTRPPGFVGVIDLLPAYRELFGVERWSIGQTMVIGLQYSYLGSGQMSPVVYFTIGLAS